MKKAILLMLLFLSPVMLLKLYAQTSVRYPVKGKQVIIDIEEATAVVEGYDGSDLIIEKDSAYKPIRPPADATGFNLLQTGIAGGDNLVHAEVQKNEPGLFSVRLHSIFNNGLNFRHWHIKVPKNTHLKVVFIISELAAKMTFKHLTNELEVEGTAPLIEFNDITGPLTLSEGISAHRIGGTEKVIVSHLNIPKTETDNNEDTPFLNIISSYGDVDIALPDDAKATVQADVGSGGLFTDMAMVQQRPAYPMVRNRYTGNLNGGGKMIVINAAHGNVFLRRQK